MKMYNGFKVIKPDEKIVGKVVVVEKEGFRLIEYYINDYDEHKKRELETFEVQPQETSEEYWKVFVKELGVYARMGTACIEEEVFKILQKESP